MIKTSIHARAFAFLAKPTGKPTAKTRGICLITVQPPTLIKFQNWYQNKFSSATQSPKSAGLVNKTDKPIAIPENDINITGKSIAEPKF